MCTQSQVSLHRLKSHTKADEGCSSLCGHAIQPNRDGALQSLPPASHTSESTDGDAQVTLGVLAEDAVSTVCLIAGNDMVACQQAGNAHPPTVVAAALAV
jgi:hypothetical protein